MKKLFTGMTIFFAVTASMMASVTVELVKKPITALAVNKDELRQKYHKAIDARKQLTASTQEANTQLQKMYQEGLELGKQYEELMKKTKNQTLTDKAKEEFSAKAEEKAQEIRKKQEELMQFQQSTNQTLTQRAQSLSSLHESEINKSITKVAQKYNVDFVFNQSSEGNLLNDASVAYSKTGYDITEEVLQDLNKDSKNK